MRNNRFRGLGGVLSGFSLGVVVSCMFFFGHFYHPPVVQVSQENFVGLVKMEKSQQLLVNEKTSNQRETKVAVNVTASIIQIKTAKSALASELFSSVRILCWVMTVKDSGEEKRKAILETWGRKCQTLLFMAAMDENDFSKNKKMATSTKEKLSPNAFIVYLPMAEHYTHLWEKTKLAFRYVHENYRNTFDWVLKIDDDSFVIMENLRLFLREKDPSEPYFYGCPYKTMGGYNSGGPGYVLSAENLKKFINTLGMPGCSTAQSGYEDIEVATCLKLVNVVQTDTRDEYKRFRFSPFEPLHTIHAKKLLPQHFKWFWSFSAYTIQEGFECCSDTFISFHYISPDLMRVMEFLIYNTSPFSGRDIWNKHNLSNFTSTVE